MQSLITSGDTLDFTEQLSAYPASAGWVLHYSLVPRDAGAAVISLTGTAAGDDHRITAAAAATATWQAGSYAWSAWVVNGAFTHTVGTGVLTVQADPRTLAAGADTRTPAARALDQAKAALAAWSPTRKSYSIAGREVTFNSVAEVLQVIAYWDHQVLIERNQAARAMGRPVRSQSIAVRLGR